MPKKLEVIPGQRFGKWTVLSEVEPYKKGKQTTVMCRCDCGKEKAVRLTHLYRGRSSKCHRCAGIRKPPGESGFNKLLTGYKYGAKNRSLEFTLTKDQFRKLVTSNCAYCGAPPLKIRTSCSSGRSSTKPDMHSSFTYNGIDRLINSEGYTSDNSITCCHECNFAKGKRTVDEFRDWLERVSAHLKTNPLPVGESDETPRS